MQVPKFVSYGVLFLTPLFFSSNLLFGKVVIANTEPWTLAFIRWSLVCLILLPFTLKIVRPNYLVLRRLLSLLGIMGFLGMWVCGAVVYYALSQTTATNAILIYLSSPVLIVIIEALARGRPVKLREALGILLASVGVVAILVRGDLTALYRLDFNAGDVAMIFAAIAWAFYSVIFKAETFTQLPSTLLLCFFSGLGALSLAPFAALEVAYVKSIPTDPDVWFNITGIVLCASLTAFLGYQHSVRFAGPAMTGIFMYLLPIYGVGLAVLVLGENFEHFHMIGILTILGGVIVATFPVSHLKRRANRDMEVA